MGACASSVRLFGTVTGGWRWVIFSHAFGFSLIPVIGRLAGCSILLSYSRIISLLLLFGYVSSDDLSEGFILPKAKLSLSPDTEIIVVPPVQPWPLHCQPRGHAGAVSAFFCTCGGGEEALLNVPFHMHYLPK